MATYTNLRYGSKGEDVKKLQTELNRNGYNLAVDGSYGPKTQEAVKQYQLSNGLNGDGIAGSITQNKLYGTSQANNTNTQGNGFNIKGLSTTQSGYDTELQRLYTDIVGRDKFSYDIDSDALYQQYAQQYADMGRMAMQDTMGQAAALTGGYNSSYAQSVGQQQYNAYLQRLNDVVPELYGAAYDRYKGEGDDLLRQYSMMQDMRDNDYERYLYELKNAEASSKSSGGGSGSGSGGTGGDIPTYLPQSAAGDVNAQNEAMRRNVAAVLQTSGNTYKDANARQQWLAKQIEMYPDADEATIKELANKLGISI